MDTHTRLRLCHQVEELVLSELEKLKKSGFTNTAVEAALNSIEFDLRENNTGSFPRGLSLMLRSMSTWIYDKDPFQPLQWTDALEHFKVCAALLQLGLLLMHPSVHHSLCPSTLTSCCCFIYIYTHSLTVALADLLICSAALLFSDGCQPSATISHLFYSEQVCASGMSHVGVGLGSCGAL